MASILEIFKIWHGTFLSLCKNKLLHVYVNIPVIKPHSLFQLAFWIETVVRRKGINLDGRKPVNSSNGTNKSLLHVYALDTSENSLRENCTM